MTKAKSIRVKNVRFDIGVVVDSWEVELVLVVCVWLPTGQRPDVALQKLIRQPGTHVKYSVYWGFEV